MTDDIFFAGIADLNARLRKREFSTVELVKAFAERLAKLGPRYNALALPLTEVAVKRAKQVDDELKRERFRGPLQGIPFGAKDLLAFAGHPTTWGAKPYAAQVFDETRDGTPEAGQNRFRSDRKAFDGRTGRRRRVPHSGGLFVRAGPESVGSPRVGRADRPAARAVRSRRGLCRLRWVLRRPDPSLRPLHFAA